MAPQKVFIHCDELDNLPYPDSCPFNTSRAGKTRRILDSMGLLTSRDRVEAAPAPASRDILEKFHTAEYLDALEQVNQGRYDYHLLGMGLGTADCPVFAGIYDYCALVCGASVLGAGMIIDGRASVAFNPSGGLHHAHPDRASGFCYMNDVVLGCMTLAEAGKRVLFLDVDVHHSDGVEEAFYDRSDVMTISLHQDGRGLFPGTGFADEIGINDGRGYAVNIPLPMGTYDRAYMRAIDRIVLPLARAYAPDVFVMEIGADALVDDPLAGLSLTNNTYADIIGELLKFDRPILATGGGGYNVENTARAWALAWTALCGDDDGGNAVAGMGGVMLETSDWHGGLRDRVIAVGEAQSCAVDQILNITIEEVRRNVFPIHSL